MDETHCFNVNWYVFNKCFYRFPYSKEWLMCLNKLISQVVVTQVVLDRIYTLHNVNVFLCSILVDMEYIFLEILNHSMILEKCTEIITTTSSKKKCFLIKILCQNKLLGKNKQLMLIKFRLLIY